MKLFISWSGETSKSIAEVLSKWIKQVIQAVEPFYSADQISKGEYWREKLDKQLADSELAIICLTKDNLASPWMMFEAGALSSNKSKSKVIPLLFGINENALVGPLPYRQCAEFSKDEMLRTMKSINEQLRHKKLESQFLSHQFEILWPYLHNDINKVLASEADLHSKEFTSNLGPSIPLMRIVKDPDDPNFWRSSRQYYKWYNAQYRLASDDLLSSNATKLKVHSVAYSLLLFECDKSKESQRNFQVKFKSMREYLRRLNKEHNVSIDTLEKLVKVRMVKVQEMPQYTYFCTKKDDISTITIYLEDLENKFVLSGNPKIALETQYELLVKDYEFNFNGYWKDTNARKISIRDLLSQSIPDSDFYS